MPAESVLTVSMPPPSLPTFSPLISHPAPLPAASTAAIVHPNNINNNTTNVIAPPPPSLTPPPPCHYDTGSDFTMSTISLTPFLSVTAFHRAHSDVGPLFVVREFDSKMIRSTHNAMTNAAPTNGADSPSEQALRASIRQSMLNMQLTCYSASKSEIRVLKARAILGKRAPSCSLLTAPDMCKLLTAFNQPRYAELLMSALAQHNSADNTQRVDPAFNGDSAPIPAKLAKLHSRSRFTFHTNKPMSVTPASAIVSANQLSLAAVSPVTATPTAAVIPVMPFPSPTTAHMHAATGVATHPTSKKKRRIPSGEESASDMSGLDALISAVERSTSDGASSTSPTPLHQTQLTLPMTQPIRSLSTSPSPMLMRNYSPLLYATIAKQSAISARAQLVAPRPVAFGQSPFANFQSPISSPSSTPPPQDGRIDSIRRALDGMNVDVMDINNTQMSDTSA